MYRLPETQNAFKQALPPSFPPDFEISLNVFIVYTIDDLL